MFRHILIASGMVAIIAGCATAFSDNAIAKLGRDADSAPSVVTASSLYGNATVNGAVRRGPRGLLEVRLPSGAWFGCGRSCSETLRMETVDFLPSHGANRSRDGSERPGYLAWNQ